MSFKKKLFKNLLTVGVYNYALRILSFFSTIILARLLSPEEYGIVALLTVFTSFISLFVDTGFSPLIIRSDYGNLFYQSLHTLTIALGGMLFLIAMLLSYPISAFYGDNNLVLPFVAIACSILLSSAMIVPVALLQKNQQYMIIGKISILEGISRILFIILFAWLGWSYWSIIIGGLIATVVKLVAVYLFTHFPFKILPVKYPLSAFRLSKSFLLNFSGIVVLNYWMRRSDNLIVGKVFGASMLGIYDRAYSLLMLPLGMISGVLSTVLLPSLKEIIDDKNTLNKEFSDLLNQIGLITMFAASALIIFPDTLVYVLWGSQWLEVAEYLPYFGVLLTLQTTTALLGNIFILKNQEKRLLKINMYVSVISISCFLVGAMYSLEIMILAYAISYSIVIVPLFIYHAFYIVMGLSPKKIVKFWFHKIVFSIAVCITVYSDYYYLSMCLFVLNMIIYLIHNKSIFSKANFKREKLAFL